MMTYRVVVFTVLCACLCLVSLVAFPKLVNAQGLRGRKNTDLFGVRPRDLGKGKFTDLRMREYAKAANDRAHELAAIPLVEPENEDTTRWMED
jgi:hypothetical protein